MLRQNIHLYVDQSDSWYFLKVYLITFKLHNISGYILSVDECLESQTWTLVWPFLLIVIMKPETLKRLECRLTLVGVLDRRECSPHNDTHRSNLATSIQRRVIVWHLRSGIMSWNTGQKHNWNITSAKDILQNGEQHKAFLHSITTRFFTCVLTNLPKKIKSKLFLEISCCNSIQLLESE